MTLKQTQHFPTGHTGDLTSNGLAPPATGEYKHLAFLYFSCERENVIKHHS